MSGLSNLHVLRLVPSLTAIIHFACFKRARRLPAGRLPLSAVIVLCFITTGFSAGFAGGTGEADDPFLIATAEQPADTNAATTTYDLTNFLTLISPAEGATVQASRSEPTTGGAASRFPATSGVLLDDNGAIAGDEMRLYQDKPLERIGALQRRRAEYPAGASVLTPTTSDESFKTPASDQTRYTTAQHERAIYVVDSLEDIVAVDDQLTLREALEAANANAAVGDAVAGSATETDLIRFDASLAGGTITLSGTQLAIWDDVRIEGPEEGLTVDAAGASRVIAVHGGPIEIINLIITGGNSSTSNNNIGGGILNGGTLTLTNCTVSGNSGMYDGGGIFNFGTLILTNTKVSRNWTRDDGGGIYNSGMLNVTNSAILGNSAGEVGGGIYACGWTRLTNSVVAGNFAQQYGGGIRNECWGTTVLSNCTVSGNTALARGGGISTGSDPYTATAFFANNSIVSLNEGSDFSGDFSGSHNLIGIDPEFVRNPHDGGDGWGDDADTPHVDESLNDDYGDLRLVSTSIALDLGDDALATDAANNLLTTDLAGNPRISGASVDIGAYEFQGTVGPNRETPSTVVTTLADVVNTTDNQTSIREALVMSWYGGLGDEVTFDRSLMAGTIGLSGDRLYIYPTFRT